MHSPLSLLLNHLTLSLTQGQMYYPLALTPFVQGAACRADSVLAGGADWLPVLSTGRLRGRCGAEGGEWAGRKPHHRDPIIPWAQRHSPLPEWLGISACPLNTTGNYSSEYHFTESFKNTYLVGSFCLFIAGLIRTEYLVIF